MENRPRKTPLRGMVVFLRRVLAVGLLLAAGCRPVLAPGASTELAAFSENSVGVSVSLRRGPDRQFFLVATFTPLEPGYHMYSKDLPRNGLNGQGRPTLLELTANSKMRAAGTLAESVPSSPVTGPPGLLVYPTGPVTLTLPVSLPPGKDWVNDEISLTFMTCSATECKAPVIGRIVPVEVPGEGAISN